jgi:hypothetical protein
MNSTSIAAYELPARVASYDADMDVMHPNRHKMVGIALEIFPSIPPPQSLPWIWERALDSSLTGF